MNAKLLLLAGLLVAFSACNPSHKDSPQADANKEQPGQHDEAMEQHDVTKTKELTLNNGAKWQSDNITRKHVSALNLMADEFEKNSNKSLESHHEFADSVQKELQQLVNDCTMKGPDHDALHIWLEPLLTDVKNLKSSNNDEDAKRASTSFINDVRKYNQFFN